jgi:hypothetical protein
LPLGPRPSSAQIRPKLELQPVLLRRMPAVHVFAPKATRGQGRGGHAPRASTMDAVRSLPCRVPVSRSAWWSTRATSPSPSLLLTHLASPLPFSLCTRRTQPRHGRGRHCRAKSSSRPATTKQLSPNRITAPPCPPHTAPDAPFSQPCSPPRDSADGAAMSTPPELVGQPLWTTSRRTVTTYGCASTP